MLHITYQCNYNLPLGLHVLQQRLPLNCHSGVLAGSQVKATVQLSKSPAQQKHSSRASCQVCSSSVLSLCHRAGNCYGLGLPPALEQGAWNDTCLYTPISQNCSATCSDQYQPGSSGPPTSACTVHPARGLVWSEPVGSCELGEHSQFENKMFVQSADATGDDQFRNFLMVKSENSYSVYIHMAAS